MSAISAEHDRKTAACARVSHILRAARGKVALFQSFPRSWGAEISAAVHDGDQHFGEDLEASL